MENRVVLITQARIGSSRLPAKVTKEIMGVSLMEIQLLRVMRCQLVNQIVVATPVGDEQRPIHEICNKLGVEYFEGSESNVLDRYYFAAKKYKAEFVVRITSDCPLIDPKLIDQIITKVIAENKDYGSNTLVETYPDGQDVEVFKFKVLENARKKVELNSDKEHVTPYIKRNCETNLGSSYSSTSVVNDVDYSNTRMTVDEKQDFDAINLLVNKLGFEASWIDYTDYILNNISEFSNQKILRNEGYLKSLKKD
jgi:spore coat polysaccharide biosynthesis protein SpsF